MTIREELHKHLTKRGLWPEEADLVIAAYRDSKASGGQLDQRLDDDTEGYPPQLMPILIMAIRAETIRWIDANKPKHFARMMFTTTTHKGS